MSDSIRILFPSMEETDLRGGTIIVRGVLDRDSIPHLRYDNYQRQLSVPSKRKAIRKALDDKQPLPSIELGVRGQHFREKNGVLFLFDPTYVIDGRQRLGTIMEYLRDNPDAPVSLAVTVHFDTDRDWEAQRFHDLQTGQQKMSPQIILRNKKESNTGIAALYGLTTNDRNFPLYNKVSWEQNMLRGELLSARVLGIVAAHLHSHRISSRGLHMKELIPALQKIADTFGIQAMRDNVKTFFELIDEAWGLRYVQARGGAPHLRETFLKVLTDVISGHVDFWDEADKRLVLDSKERKRFKNININDPEIIRLTSSAGMARNVLYNTIIDRLNKGRHKKLTPRIVKAVEPEVVEEAA